MSAISIKQLLEAGVHFGHQTRRWNPKMKPYIFGQRNGIHIVDLQTTLRLFKEAVEFLTDMSSRGKTVLFVGTKRQAQESISEEAQRCGMYYVNNRWLGGLLTNFVTVRNSIKRYKDLEEKRADGFYEKLSKKEVARLERERKKLEKNLRGIRDMDRLPDALFVVDSNRESIAVQEAAKLNIPIIAVVDTNGDPDYVDYVIPGNDDALRAVRLFSATAADAVLAGRGLFEAEKAEAEAVAKAEAKPEAKAEAKPEAKAEAKPEAKAEAKPEAKAEAKPEAKAEAKPEAKAEAKPEAKAEAKPEAKAEAKPEAKAKPKPEAKAKPKPEAKAKPKPEAKAKPKPEAKAKPETKAKPKKAPKQAEKETKKETKKETAPTSSSGASTKAKAAETKAKKSAQVKGTSSAEAAAGKAPKKASEADAKVVGVKG